MLVIYKHRKCYAHEVGASIVLRAVKAVKGVVKTFEISIEEKGNLAYVPS